MKSRQFPWMFTAAIGMVMTVAAVISCNKKFDAPPAYIPPNVTATKTIADLKSIHASGVVDSLTADDIIEGVVIANDSSGNFYKQIVIQDATGGIAISIDDYNLYTSFPIGRKVYLKLKGLFMSEDAGLLYIGTSPDTGGSLTGIPSRLKDSYLIKGELNVPVTPADVTIDELKSNNEKYMYTLVRLNNFEVKATDTSKTWANAVNKTDANITVKSCEGDTMIVRSSGFAYFAGIKVPTGNGALTAVYAYYKSPYNNRITPQVIIRDTADAQFTGSRCDGSTPPPADGTVKTIKEIRDMYTGSDMKLANYIVGGVVISDAVNKNVTNGLVVIQSGDYGISVYMGGTISYNVGDSIVLNLGTSDSLLKYRGSLEIKTNRNFTKPAAVATGKVITPKEVTAKQLSDNMGTMEYTLVKIKGATASGSTTYSGNQTLTDASGTITMYTAAAATFASTALPTGANDWVGYGSSFNTTKQFQIRNTNDVTAGTGGPVTPPDNTGTADLMFTEYVEGSSNNKYLEIYNAGTAAADLSKYMVKLYANGGTTVTNQAKLDTFKFGTTLAAGATILFRTGTAALSIPAGVTTDSSTICFFNGNDALTLEKSGTVIDVIGKVGEDPGNGKGWTVSGTANATLDHTIRRKAAITKGNTDWAASSASEWDVLNKDDVSGLGSR